MNKRGGKGLLLTVFAAIAVILFAWYQNINSSYPYYFIWDMDQTTTLDTLLINSEMLPDHINHTGFGMYFLLGKTALLGHAAGAVSAATLSEVKGSLNPIMTTAELTGFIRAHQPFLILAIGLLLSVSLYLLFDISGWIVVLGLAVIGASEGLAYHASMIRTELYSVFFWAGAVLANIIAIRSDKAAKANLLHITGGVLLGLSFTTKVQSLFYLVATGLFVVLINYYKEPLIKNPSPAKSKWPIWAGLFNWVVFLLLAKAAYWQVIPAGVMTFARGFGISLLGKLLFATLVGLFIWQVILAIINSSCEWYRKTAALNYMAFGFVLSFFLHFAMYTNAALGWYYLLVDYKMIFLRDSLMISQRDLGAYMRDFVLYVNYNPVMFVALSLVNILVVINYIKSRTKIGELILTLLITAVLLVNIPIGTRYILRDTLWKEIIINFWILFLMAYIFKNFAGRGIVKVVIITALALLVSNISHSFVMSRRTDANYNIYGWQQDAFFRGVYGGNEKLFSDIVNASYTAKTLGEAKQQAESYKKIKRAVEFVFTNQDITLRNIGIAQEGFGICTTDLAWRLVSVPEVLQRAILVDNSEIATTGTCLLKEEYVSQQSEYMDKFDSRHRGDDNKMAVLGRSDLAIFLFAPENDINGLVSYNIIKQPFKITAAKGNERIEFTGAEVKNYALIPREKLRGRYFFIVRMI